MLDVVRFISRPQLDVPIQAVYLKERWHDEWQLVPELWCREATWCMAPSLSTAQIVYRYGNVLEIGALEFTRRFPLDRLRFYVRVDFAVLKVNDDDPSDLLRSWYGIIDAELDEQLGPDLVDEQGGVIAYPRGRNHYLAYGLEVILATSWIDRSALLSSDGSSEEFVGRALAFNPGLADYNPDPVETTGEGNRSESGGPAGPYLFHNRRTGGSIWSTFDACDYLLHYGPSRNYNNEQLLPFYLEDADGALPTWDQPIERCEGRAVGDLLNTLIARQRALAWRPEVRPSQDGDRIAIVPCTFFGESIFLADQTELKANPHQVILCWEQDRGATPVIKRMAMDAVDQVIARGTDPRTSTATYSFKDETFVIGWPDALETGFEKAASEAGDYPAATETTKRMYANAAARMADKFKPVFARYVMPDPFDGYVGDGVSGTADQVLMPSDQDEDTPAPWAPDDQRFLQFTAFLEGFQYDGDAIDSGSPTEFGNKPHKHQKPLVLFPRPNLDDQDTTKRYFQADKVGLLAALDEAVDKDLGWSAQVRVDDDDGALWVEIGNGFNYLIAKTDFTRLPADQIEPMADYRDMLATLTVAWSFFPEAKYPEEAPFGSDVVRTIIIRAPFHRLDYVVPGTVVALDEKTGELLRTDSGGFIRDDRDKLNQIARLAFEWYGKPRKSVSFGTSLVNNRLQLGDLVVSIGDPTIGGNVHIEDINSVITSIRIVSPLGEGEGDVGPPPPRIEYETGFGELDVLRLTPRLRQR
jgi:hypothetical protein